MKNALFALLFVIPFCTQAQVFLNGYLLDSIGNPLPYNGTITLLQDSVEFRSTLSDGRDSTYLIPDHYATYSDHKGAFHLLVDTTKLIEFQVSSWGYANQTIKLNQLPPEPLIITMYIDRSMENNKFYPSHHPRAQWHPTELGLGLDFLSKDFEDFNSILGTDNSKQLGKLPLNFTFDFGKLFKRVYTGIAFGFSFNEKTIDDSLRVTVNGNLWALHLGYRIVDQPQFLLMPKVAIKRYRFRLLNSRHEEGTLLTNYLENKDLDLRIIQPTADFGFTMAYKYRQKGYTEGAYVLFGLHAGYPVKLRKTPRITGLRSRLDTDRRIELGDFGLHLFLRAHFE